MSITVDDKDFEDGDEMVLEIRKVYAVKNFQAIRESATYRGFYADKQRAEIELAFCSNGESLKEVIVAVAPEDGYTIYQLMPTKHHLNSEVGSSQLKEAQAKILKKLSPAERKVLGYMLPEDVLSDVISDD